MLANTSKFKSLLYVRDHIIFFSFYIVFLPFFYSFLYYLISPFLLPLHCPFSYPFSPLNLTFHLLCTSPFFDYFILILTPTSNFIRVLYLSGYAPPINFHSTKCMYLRDLHKFNSSPLILTSPLHFLSLPLQLLKFLIPFAYHLNHVFPSPFKLYYPTLLTLPYTPFIIYHCAPSLFPPPLKPYPKIAHSTLICTTSVRYLTHIFVNNTRFLFIIVINYSFISDNFIFSFKWFLEFIHIFLKVIDILLLIFYSNDGVIYLLFYLLFLLFYVLISCTFFNTLPFSLHFFTAPLFSYMFKHCHTIYYYLSLFSYFFLVILCYKKISEFYTHFSMSGNKFVCYGTSSMNHGSFKGLLIFGHIIFFLLLMYFFSQLINQSHP